MRTKKRLLPALVASALLSSAAPAAMAQSATNPGLFDRVVVFGDSLSDAGFYRPFLLGLGLPAPLVASMGRFTTNPGPVWSETVSRYYGTDAAPSNASGSIYAQGGARVTGVGYSTPPGSAERSVTVQIGEYLAANGGHADPNSLFTLWAGANDIFYQLGALQAGAINASQLQANVLQAATDEITQVGRLRAAGARYIMVFALPDIGATPAFANTGATGAAVTQLSAGYNTTLFAGLQTAGLRVIPVDTFTLFKEISANPSAYGFTNITSPACGLFPPIVTRPQDITSLFCNPSTLVAPNASTTYAFADYVHPTTGAHAIVANFVEQLIDAPIQYSLLPQTALGVRMSVMRSLNDTLLAAPRQGASGISVFVNANGGNYDVGSGSGSFGINSNTRAVDVGATMHVGDAATLGIAFGESRLHGNFGNDMGSFETRDRAVSLFGGFDWLGFYGTGVVAVGNLEFMDVQRNIHLGPALRTAQANPKGSESSSFFTAGYDFSLGPVRLGPVVTLNTANVTVNAFDESNAGSANLRIAEQNLRSEVWGIGARVSGNFAGWSPWARVTVDRERKNNDRMVTATPISLATGNSYDLPAYSPDRDFVTTSLGVTGWLGPNILVGFNGYHVSGRSGARDEGLGATLAVKF